MTALGGRAAQLEFDQPRDTGASNDFEQANRIARFMVGAYGMSDLGPIQLRLDDQGFPAVPLSPHLATKFDEAWTKLVNDLWGETQTLVKKERERINRIAKALFIEETILGARYKQLYDGTETPSEESQPK
jgi:cell division protease FtsH